MYSDILVPTDGSQGSSVALEHGVALASQFDATIHALYVVDMRMTRSGPHIETLRQEGREAIREVETVGSRSGLTVVTGTVEGNPHEEILAYASKHGIDMIVMGTHGRTGLDRVVMGSVAERVVRQSPVPVLTVRPSE